jgi:hypothetical protein
MFLRAFTGIIRHSLPSNTMKGIAHESVAPFLVRQCGLSLLDCG